jgi:hypothetical protein
MTTAHDTTQHGEASREIRSEPVPRRRWSRGKRRKTLLTIHIASAVALLGGTAGFLVIAARAATRDDRAEAHTLYEALGQLPLFTGIPLSFIALGSGILVALTSKWGLFRYWWVTAKLVLLVGVILLGAFVNSRTTNTMIDATAPGGDGQDSAERILVGSVVLQLAMVLAAVVLAVFKPGGRIRRVVPGKEESREG